MKRTTARAVYSALLFLFLMMALVLVPFAWILRDGLGPGSVPSSGWEAVVRCYRVFYIGPALTLMGLAVLGTWVMSRAWGEE